MDQPEVKPDEEFEAFLAEKVAALGPECRPLTVTLLARAGFYGESIFELLYPEEAAAPPDLTYPDSATKRTFAKPSYRAEDSAAAGLIWRQFADANWERYEHYGKLCLSLQGIS